jgi:hypothetical protein
MGAKYLLSTDTPDWVERAKGLDEGAYAAILVEHGPPCDVGVSGRTAAGLVLRDTLLVVGASLDTNLVLLFRKPLVATRLRELELAYKEESKRVSSDFDVQKMSDEHQKNVVAYKLRHLREEIELLKSDFRGDSVLSATIANGTGGLNVQMSRVGTSGGTKRSAQAPYPKRADGREDRSFSWARTGHEVLDINAGRWPPNVVFVHAERCVDAVCDNTCPTRIRDSTYFPVVKADELFQWLETLLRVPDILEPS